MPKYDNFSREELIELLQKQDKELARKKYGLVWDSEKEPEQVVLDCAKKLPILKNIAEKDIKTNDDDYNIMIEGDNYHALQVLNYTHKGKIDIIYIDPPYNTGEKDFKYNDKFVDKEDGYRHSKWLNFMEKRLDLAKDLLSETGVIFISIDENEETNLSLLMNKIYGEKNFIEKIIWNKRIPKNDKGIGNIHEYILLYVKNKEVLKHKFIMNKEGLDDIYEFMKKCKRSNKSIKDTENALKVFYKKNSYDRGITLYCQVDENYRPWGKINVSWPNDDVGPRYEIYHPLTNKPVKIPVNGWRYKKESFFDLMGYDEEKRKYNNKKVLWDGSVICNKVWFAKDENTQPSTIKYLDEVESFLLRSIISLKSSGGTELNEIVPHNKFKHPKTFHLINILLNSIDKKNALVLDFFAGSGTTGHAVLEQNKQDNGNRKFIICTNNEGNIATEVCYPRVQKVIQGYNKNGNEEFIEGLGGNLKYFKTDFVVNSKNKTQTKINLAKQCSEMLCLKTGIYNLLDEENPCFKLFDNNKHNKFLCVYFDFFGNNIQEFIHKIQILNGEKFVFMFSLDENVDKSLFEGIENIKIEPIPQKILDVYKKIAKEHIKGDNHD